MTAYESQVIDHAQPLDVPPADPAEERCDVCGRPETHDNLLMTCEKCGQRRCKRCSTRVERLAHLCREHLPPDVGELVFALESCKADAKRLAKGDLLEGDVRALGAWRTVRLEAMGV
jgi:hypothetical protein